MPYKKPAYYQEIEERFDKLEGRQREFRESLDNFIVSKAEERKQLLDAIEKTSQQYD